AAQSWPLTSRRFGHAINTDEVFSTHTRNNVQRRGLSTSTAPAKRPLSVPQGLLLASKLAATHNARDGGDLGAAHLQSVRPGQDRGEGAVVVHHVNGPPILAYHGEDRVAPRAIRQSMRAYEPVALLPVDNEDPRVFAKDRFRVSRVVGPVFRLTLDEALPGPDPRALKVGVGLLCDGQIRHGQQARDDEARCTYPDDHGFLFDPLSAWRASA